MREWGRADRQYVQMARRHLAGAVVAAAAKAQPARISVGYGEHHWLAWNRTGKDVIDPTVGALWIEALEGDPKRPLAILAFYACHPVILGPKPVISADYPGALRRYLASRYPGSVILFTNGACGDVDPVTNREVWGQGTFNDVEHAGAALGEDVCNLSFHALSPDTVQLRVGQGSMRLHYNVPPLDTVREMIKTYAAQARRRKHSDERYEAVTGTVTMPRFWLGYYRTLEKRIMDGQQPDYIDVQLQVIALDQSLALLAIPAEVYAAQGLAIRTNSPYQHTLPICYANGLVGYVPPREEFEKASYTASLGAAVYDQAPFCPGVAEALVEAAIGLLRQTWKQGVKGKA